MDADEIVVGREQRDGVGVVLDLLGKGVRQPGEPVHVHSHGEVRPLHVGRGDVLHVGVALDAGLLDPGAFGRAVAARGAGRRAIQFHELGVVDIGPEGAFHGLQIGPVAVAGELDAVGEAGRQIVDEPLGALAVPAADEPRSDELRVRVERGPRPGVPGALGSGLGRGHVLLLSVGEGPDLIDLDPLGAQLPHVLVMVGSASLARVDHELNDRVLPHVHPNLRGAGYFH